MYLFSIYCVACGAGLPAPYLCECCRLDTNCASPNSCITTRIALDFGRKRDDRIKRRDERTGQQQCQESARSAVFLFVIGTSFLVATSRGMRWNKLLAGNTPIMLFYLYFALSLFWSGDPTGSLKRLSKDFGLLFVIGLIYSEKDPVQAIRAVFVRTAFVLIPLSVLFVKFYPEYARAYTIAGDIMITGVTTQKNSLGETILLFTLFLVWDYLEALRRGSFGGRGYHGTA